MTEAGNSLTDWSNMLDRHFAARQARDDEDLAKAKEQLPERIAALKNMDNVTLMETCIGTLGRGFADPRMTAVIQEYGEAAKQLIIERLDSTIFRSMDSAPLDGKHCILAIKRGAFVYSVQGFYYGGKWISVLTEEGQSEEPLGWMLNKLLPDELCPWKVQKP